MSQLKKIKYKSIFINDQQKEVIEYEENGIITKGELTSISFSKDNHVIDISYDENQVILTNDDSKLYLYKDKMIDNQYKLPIGEANLTTKLIHLVVRNDFVGIKYELYDINGLICTVYITINIISL